MAICAPTKSAQVVDYDAHTPITPYDWGSKLRCSYATLTFTAAGSTTAALGDITLLHLPPGKIRLLPNLCRIICPAGSTNAQLDVGYGAYTEPDGTAKVLDGDAWVASLVITSAVNQDFDDSITADELNSKAGIPVVCSFDTADSPAAGDLHVWVVYQMGN